MNSTAFLESTETNETPNEAHVAVDVKETKQEKKQEAIEKRTVSLLSNQVVLTLSFSLMNQIKEKARAEGVSIHDMLLELVSEGVTKRVFEDNRRTTPSHLMTRTGYVSSENGENNSHSQPSLSHHNQNNGFGNRGKSFGGPKKRFTQNESFQGKKNFFNTKDGGGDRTHGNDRGDRPSYNGNDRYAGNNRYSAGNDRGGHNEQRHGGGGYNRGGDNFNNGGGHGGGGYRPRFPKRETEPSSED